MAFLATVLPGIMGTTAAAGTAVASTAATGLSISSILQGVATVGGVVASIASGNDQAASLEAQARDAQAEQGIETLQSVERKRGLLKQAQESVGQIDTAYAGSGVDLSFGSAQEARTQVFRNADIALNSDSATTGTRLSRLDERSQNLFRMAAGARQSALFGGALGLLRGYSRLSQQA
jgi:hypothetical protein